MADLFDTKFCQFPEDKAAARVAVAQDVIDRVKARQYTVRNGYGYVRQLGDWEAPVQNLTLDGIAKDCAVCALGGMLLSSFHLYDGEGFQALSFGAGRCEVTHQLEGLFDREQMTDIERAFESPPGPEYVMPASIFGSQFATDEERIIAIMQNIVDNNGEFIP